MEDIMFNIQTLLLILTNRCNFACPHCARNCTTIGEDMFDHIIDAVIRFVIDNKFKRVGFTGGEPTLHPKLLTTMMELKRRYPSCVLSLQTNGSWMHDRNIDLIDGLAKMARDGDLSVFFSVDPLHRAFIPDLDDCIGRFRLKADPYDLLYTTAIQYIDCYNGRITLIGRAIRNKLIFPTGTKLCGKDCESNPVLTILPSGDISLCSSRKMIIGHVASDSRDSICNALERALDHISEKTCYEEMLQE
jgi:hypothetical protein